MRRSNLLKTLLLIELCWICGCGNGASNCFYIHYIGPQDYFVEPVIVTTEQLSADELKRFFKIEALITEQFIVSKEDMNAMEEKILALLPRQDCDLKIAQFEIKIRQDDQVTFRNLDQTQAGPILEFLKDFSHPKYWRLYETIIRTKGTSEDGEKLSGRNRKVTVPITFDPEEQKIIDAAKKEAERLGYNVKKFDVHLFMHGRDSSVYFCPPKSDVINLTILVESETGKILNVKKEKSQLK